MRKPASPVRSILVVLALCAGTALVACHDRRRDAAAAGGQSLTAAMNGYSAPAGQAVPLFQAIANPYCHGLAPAGWGITDQDRTGTIFVLTAPDGHASGGYGLEPIGAAMPNGGTLAMQRVRQIAPYLPQPAMPAGASGAQYATPLTTMEFTLRRLFGQDTQISQAPQPDARGATVLVFSGAQKHGQLAFTPVPDGRGNTSIQMRIASVNNGVADTELAAAVAVANSVICSYTLPPPPPPQ